jgi:hypothetical protein
VTIHFHLTQKARRLISSSLIYACLHGVVLDKSGRLPRQQHHGVAFVFVAISSSVLPARYPLLRQLRRGRSKAEKRRQNGTETVYLSLVTLQGITSEPKSKLDM